MAADTGQATVCYVYGIVPADVEENPDAAGLGDPPRPVTVVRHGEVAALVSELPSDGPPLGEPEDLRTHANVLDAAAGVVPVLPLRFGSVVRDRDAVEGELLGAHQDEFAEALRKLDGHAEYVLRGRYRERVILDEVLAENDEAARLREAIRDKPPDTARDERIALGELITEAIAAKREQDGGQAAGTLERLDATLSPREPTHERDAVHLAILLEVEREGELEKLAGALAETWAGRVELRLLGPLAPYDFVTVRE